jgi:cobalt-zinc-cadmium efflux system membrane fusion protein
MNRVAFAVLVAACTAQGAPPPEQKSTTRSTPNVIELAPEAERTFELRTRPVRRRAFGDRVTVFGELQLRDDAVRDVVAPARGFIDELPVTTGTRVRKGQLLALLRSAEAARTRAEVLVARAQREAADRELRRVQVVVRAGIRPQGEEDRARAAALVATARHDAALARLGALGFGLGIPADPQEVARLRLVAPSAGVVLERPAHRGGSADEGTLLYRLADLGRLWFVARLYERDAARLVRRGPVTLSLLAFPGETFRGKIEIVTGAVDPKTRSVPVRVRPLDGKGRLRPGMTGSAELPLATDEPVLAVPASAVQRVEGGWAVFLALGNGRYEVRGVRRGRAQGREVEILEGVREGEAVVSEGAFVLRTEAGRR